MPDLNLLPPDLIAPFALVFALALFVSKVFDIYEKWQKLRSANSSRSANKKAGTENSSSLTESIEVVSPQTVSTLTSKGVFLFSFVGAITISVLSSLIQFTFINSAEYLVHQLSSVFYSAFFGLVSAIICTYFIRNKFPLVGENKVVAALMGFGVSALISMPVSIIMNIVQINQIYSQ